MRECSICKVNKPLNEFYKDARFKIGVKRQCKECFNKRRYSKREGHLIEIRLRDRCFMGKYNQRSIGKFYKVKTTLRRRGISLSISKDDFIEWFDNVARKCFYCGSELTMTNGDRGHKMTDLTIDRKDNKLGYAKNNLVIACRRCNMIKGAWFTEDQMVEIANKYLNN